MLMELKNMICSVKLLKFMVPYINVKTIVFHPFLLLLSKASYIGEVINVIMVHTIKDILRLFISFTE